MKRVLLNKIFSKFPKINIALLIDLSYSDLEEILSSDTLLDAKKRLKKLIDEKNKIEDNNSKSLALDVMFYVNY